MAETLILFQLPDAEHSLRLGRAIRREHLYGNQRRSVEKNGIPLQKVLVTLEGRVILPGDLVHLPTDTGGSLASPALFQSEDGTSLEILPSSFKVKRPLTPAGLEALARLRVDTVFPVECTVPQGVYTTEFAYRDSPVLKSAALIVTDNGAFLLVGIEIDTPLQGRTDLYSFFDEPEDDDEEPEGEEMISFQMF